MRTQLENLDINYERFSAINGKELKNLNEKAAGLCTTLLCNPGMIGCALSHTQVLKNFTESEEDFLCVMEDDITINENIKAFLENVENLYKNINFDMISLVCSGFCGGPQTHYQIYKLIRPAFPLRTACYIVSKEGAQKILEMLGDKVEYHIDFLIAMKNAMGKINYYVLESPNLVYTNDAIESTMGSQCKSVVLHLLDSTKCHKAAWMLRVPALSFKLKHTVSIYHVILFVLLVVAVATNNKILSILCAAELLLMFKS
jgi:GR25 family glycosyltransferase involved in LPS biosynthesis